MGYGVVLSPGARGAADPTHVRAHNLSLVLRLIYEHQPISRTELASRTGLARASLTTLVPELVSYGLVRESDTRPRSGAGRPSTDLWIDGSATVVVVAELASTGAFVETFNLAETSIRSSAYSASVRSDGVDRAVEALAIEVRQHLDWAERADQVCIRVVVVLPDTARIGRAGNVRLDEWGWPELNLLDALQERLEAKHIDVTLASAVASAGLAEFWAHANSSSGPGSAIFLTSNSGVRGVVISHGEVLMGGDQSGFELAHVNVRPDGELCDCGRLGCLVAEAGEAAITRRAGIEAPESQHFVSALAELIRLDREGDRRSRMALDQLGDSLGRFIRNLQLLFEPDVVIIGGFWGECFDRLHLHGGPSNTVHPSILGAAASRSGAIKAAIHELFEDPAAIGERRLEILDLRRRLTDSMADSR